MSNLYWENLGFWATKESTYQEAAQSLANWVGQQAQLQPESILLDLGCGTGVQIRHWENAFAVSHIIGIETDPCKIKNLKVMYSNNPRVVFHRNLESLNTEYVFFDRFVLVDCLYFFPKKMDVISRLINSLSVTGVGVWTDFSVSEKLAFRPIFALVSLVSNIPRESWHSRNTTEKFLAQFATIECQSFDLTHQVLSGYARGQLFSSHDPMILKIRKFFTKYIIVFLLKLKAIEYVGFRIIKKA